MSQKNSKAPWIIDLGASDHTIGTFQLFSSRTPCSNNLRVQIANGSLSIVAGKGSIKIFENITLTSVLYIPNISCNLMSISKLTKDFSDIAKFSSSCEFQELHSRKTIDNAKVHEGLYFFRGEDSRTRQPLAFGFKSISVSDDEIML